MAADPVLQTQLDCEISGDKIKGLFVIYVIGTGGLLRGWLLGQGTTYDVFASGGHKLPFKYFLRTFLYFCDGFI